MKKLFALFLSVSFGTFGQSDQPTVKFKRFSAGINFSPDIAYKKLHNYNELPADQWEKQKEQDARNFRPRPGFSTGGHISYNLTKRLSLEAGAQYSLKGYQRKPSYGAMTFQGEILFEGDMKDHYNFNFIDVPLTLNYVVFDGQLQMVATAGLAWNHMRHNSVKHFNKETVNDEFVPVIIMHTPYRENTFSYIVGLGIQYKVTENVALKAVPTFRYAVLPIKTNLAQSAYYWTAGLNISCSVRLF